jgi:hypothetical protein
MGGCAVQSSALIEGHGAYAATRAGTGKAVTDFIFSMAKRDVTFFNATAPINFL